MLRVLFDVYAGLLGLVVGSYLNVLIHRLPRGSGTVRSRSACPYCGGPIRARDNLPLLSFVLLGGRCRHCRAPISWRYPIVETLSAGLFVLLAERFGLATGLGRALADGRPLAPTLLELGPPTLAAAIFGCLLLSLAAIDLEHYLLPDKLTLSGILVGLAAQPWIPGVSFLDAVGGTLIGAGLVVLVTNFWYWLRGEEGMGMGDVNMVAMVGAFLGWQGVLVTFAVGTLAGALTGLALLAAGRLGMRSRLPFGVFLALGAAVALFVGDKLVAVYSGWL